MDKIWWEQLNSPSRFIRDAAEKLSGGKSVIMCLPRHIPWARTMREVLEKRLRRSGTLSLKFVDAENISDKPPEFVFKEFCEDKNRFRPARKSAHAKFMAEREGISLNSSCIWIRNANAAQVEEWLSFIIDYHGFLKGRRGGVFLLEADDDLNFGGKAGVEVFSYAERISDYDSFAFNIFIAAEFGKDNHLMKQYLAELVSALTEGDVEFGAACIKRGENFLREPAVVFENILSTDKFTSPKTAEDIDRAIWMTQLKLIFPLVETFRRNFIKQYADQIKNTPPFYSEPEEVEIGHLYGQFNNNQRRKFIGELDANDLEFYREVRNKLAHLKILPFDELQKIFEKNSRR